MKTLKWGILCCSLVMLFQACGNGRQNNENAKDPVHDQLNNSADLNNESKTGDDDHWFMTNAAAEGLYEVKVNEYIQSHSYNAKIRQIAAKIAQDHQKANQELGQLAEQKNVLLPDQLPENQQKQLDDLLKLNGDALDAAYLKAMKEAHLHDIQIFKEAETYLRHPKLRKFAEDKLPVLESHLKMIEETN